jgi:hypothetical protein
MSENARKTAADLTGESYIALAAETRNYRLPKCQHASLTNYRPNTTDLVLITEGGHRVLIELDSNTAEGLYKLLRTTFSGSYGK